MTVVNEFVVFLEGTETELICGILQIAHVDSSQGPFTANYCKTIRNTWRQIVPVRILDEPDLNSTKAHWLQSYQATQDRRKQLKT